MTQLVCDPRGGAAKATVSELRQCSGPAVLSVPAIEYYLGQAQRQLEQVERHLQDGETISHREKVFSIFETHTRWKQKASRV